MDKCFEIWQLITLIQSIKDEFQILKIHGLMFEKLNE